MMKSIVNVLWCSILLVACSSPSDVARDTALRQLSTNREKWTAQGVHNYSFDYDVTANAFSPPLHIEVRNDLVSSANDRNTGAAVATANVPTIDSLFTRIDALIRGPNPDISVTYDGSLGYPLKIEEGSSIPDAASVTTVTNLQQVP